MDGVGRVTSEEYNAKKEEAFAAACKGAKVCAWMSTRSGKKRYATVLHVNFWCI